MVKKGDITSSTAADKVIRDLEQAATTTPQTLRTLRALLGLDLEEHGIRAPPKRPQAARSDLQPVLSRSRAKSSTKPVKAPIFEIYESPEETPSALPLANKYKLAIESFNSSLKVLSGAVKLRQQKIQEKSSPPTSPECSTKLDATVLQQCSANRQKRQTQVSCKRDGDGEDLDPVVKCACTALDALYLSDLPGKDDKSQNKLRRSQGGLVLLDKLISLGMTQVALSQASKFYVQHWSSEAQSPLNSSLLEQSSYLKLADQIAVNCKTLAKADFDLIASFHTQILRLAIATGPRVINEAFIDAVRLTNEGSPAGVVCKAWQMGYIDAEKAGLQLRTISQALLKLYSNLASAKLAPVDNKWIFSLLIQAFVVKCRSWQLVEHAPELHRELWPHILKGCKRLDHQTEHTDAGLYAHISREVRFIQNTLKDSGFAHGLSYNLCDCLSSLLERSGKKGDALRLLEQECDCSTATPVQLVGRSMRIAVLRYASAEALNRALLNGFEDALKALESAMGLGIEEKESLVLYAVRLRKTALSIITHNKSSLLCSEDDDNNARLQVCLLNILQAVLGLIRSAVFVHKCLDQHVKTPKDNRGLLTNLAKTLEAICDLETLYQEADSILRANIDKVLEECQSVICELLQHPMFVEQDASLAAFVRSLAVRMSDLWYRQFSRSNSQLSSDSSDLMRLQGSVSIAALLPPKLQHSASLGTKLEKLAIVHLRMKDTILAGRSFENAIGHYIAAGALESITSAPTDGSRTLIWNQSDSKAYVLNMALRSHTKLALAHGIHAESSGKWFYDNPNLSDLQRYFILQQQVCASADHHFTTCQTKELLECIEEIFEISDRIARPAFRPRFALSLLKLTLKYPEFPGTDALDAERVAQICSSISSTDSSISPLDHSRWLQHALAVQWSIHTGRVDFDILSRQIGHICHLVLHASIFDELESIVEDVSFAFRQLQTVLSYARMLDDNQIQLQCLSALSHILRLQTRPADDLLVNTTWQLGLLHSRIGNVEEAQKLLQTVAQDSSKSVAAVRLHLARAEHFLIQCDNTEAEKMLQRASLLFQVVYEEKSSLSGRSRLERDAVLSWAARLASRLTFSRGDLGQAAVFARQAVKISSGIWQAVEKTQPVRGKDVSDDTDEILHSITQDISSLTISSDRSSLKVTTKGASFWDFADLHFLALANIGTVSLHAGLYQDASYYLEQFGKTAHATGSLVWICRASSSLALLHAKAGDRQKAHALLERSKSVLENLSSLEDFEAVFSTTEAFIEVHEFSRAQLALQSVRKHIVPRPATKSEDVIAASSLKKPTIRGRARNARATEKQAKRPAAKSVKRDAMDDLDASQELRPREKHISDCVAVLYSQLHCASEGDQLSASDEQLIQVKQSLKQPIRYQISSAMLMLHHALQALSSGAVKCVLAETAVALPVRYKSDKRHGRVSLIPTGQVPATARTQKPKRAKAPKECTAEVDSPSAGERLLVDAHTLLCSISESSLCYIPSDVLHTIGKVQSLLALLASTMSTGSQLSSFDTVLQPLLPKNTANHRELLAVKAEKSTNTREQVLTWPNISPIDLTSAQLDSLDDLADIPSSWSVMSLSVAEDKRELLVSKLGCSKSPFMLRIPLSRTDEIQDDDEVFTFEEAKAELLDIVTKANASCHDLRGQGDKQARRAWYTEREVLDQRLGALLNNIENIWLGGFRGLFSSQQINSVLLAKFGGVLTQSLDNHLPSRQKPGQTGRAELHDHVLELFVGLGDPTDQELDDALTDLLYFVVDILQFSGERNAYDEIDFDAILVDVIDALRAYHDQTSTDTYSQGHTILILDKELASFPWESLPCLQGQSVSRMPSLKGLIERVRSLRNQAQDSTSFRGPLLPVRRGAYMLNPSSDLVSTEATFAPILQSNLPDFSSTVRQPPTEQEFEATLRDNDLFLYLGHGSGAQYIRGRTIRALDKCAVTLLMGCSSAKMTECGKFESYGMPGYYISGMSGCTAVVGTLWDVTDRDIDRFAVKLMSEWGLIEEDELVEKALERSSKKQQHAIANATNAKGKGKGKEKAKVSTIQTRRGKVGLDEAVRKGREACLLKYLNGAAPVMYGVPVFLA